MNIAGTPTVFTIKKLRYAYTVFLTKHITILLLVSRHEHRYFLLPEGSLAKVAAWIVLKNRVLMT
jgi:hypothetical protein